MASNPQEIQMRELKEMITDLRMTIKQLNQSLEQANVTIAQLREQNEYLTKKLFGSSSEKRKPKEQQVDGQLTIFDMFSQMFDEVEYDHDATVPEQEEVIIVKEHKRKPKKSLKEKFKDLPVKEIEIPLSPEEQFCENCGSPLEKVGRVYDRQELIYIPATVMVVKYYHTTYRCPACTEGMTEGVDHYFKSSRVPPALIPGSYSSESLVSWCIYQKYKMALPLYRMEQDWSEFGVELSRTTMANWVIYCSEHYFKPLYDYFHRELLKREFLMADETRVQVLREPERRAQSQSFMWLVRSGEDDLPPIILYDYTKTRARYNIMNFLEGYEGGYLMVDGYQGYNSLPNLKRCGCWAHVRRAFYDAIPKGSQHDISEPAVQAVNYCDQLFLHERHCKEKNYSSKQRKAYRDRKSKPVIDAFFAWLDRQIPMKNSRFDKAVGYAQNQKKYLYTYLEDGRCSLSNNLSENAIRPFTVGRKNWLFAATPEGAGASAICYSMVEMAKAHGLSIYRYLNYVLSKRPDKNMLDEELMQLAPWNETVIKCCTKNR